MCTNRMHEYDVRIGAGGMYAHVLSIHWGLVWKLHDLRM